MKFTVTDVVVPVLCQANLFPLVKVGVNRPCDGLTLLEALKTAYTGGASYVWPERSSTGPSC